MKKLAVILAVGLMVSISLTSMALAGGSNTYTCNTRYPVILAHGMGASTKVLGIVDYWWGIVPALQKQGASVYCTTVNAMDSTANKAASFKQQVMQIMAATGAKKVNIIGHSHGTIYTRYAISNLGLAPYVASYTSLAGPHRGSSIASLIMYELPDWLLAAGGDVIDFVYAFIFGDTSPDSLQNALDICPDYMINTFNPNTPNMPGIYYQSWAAKAKTACPSVILNPTWLVMLVEEGANDGLVSVESAKWGNFRGVQEAAWYSTGCDHLNIVGQLFGVTPGFDAPQFFVDIVKDLKARGY
ncbi:MAG: alpha/beta fold hydrolase [Thermodesulfobacteriota bacterium]